MSGKVIMTIFIKKLSDTRFEVSINDNISTIHIVTLSDETYQNFTNGKITKEELITFSFKFLLDREPNTSILSKFELPTISKYFPEYDIIVKQWLGRTFRHC